ncbi:hypothetical protein [Mycobacterium sp. 94-17]|uniref:hypothetical protein n=1 Tax=Mycobacterium sp. 94-17 TaxID=2986147 RepID=UPI002D1E5045|nr:hypothetical protein [Mycobacterium sp. 94-17]MEB4211092.1 hypothetical protein [Mycobacterium sp. 94-17]
MNTVFSRWPPAIGATGHRGHRESRRRRCSLSGASLTLASGELFRIGGGRFNRYGIYGNKGIENANLTAEFVADRFAESRDMSDSEIVSDAAYDMARFNATLASDWQKDLTSDWCK